MDELLDAIKVQSMLVSDVVNRVRMAGTQADAVALNRVRRAVADLFDQQSVIEELAAERAAHET